jgi:hydroxymethylbilane synthase
MTSVAEITIATRESRLALWQAEHIKALLEKYHPGITVKLLGMTTTGDQILDRTLAQVGGKGLFVKELEVAMEEGRAHLAVHSMKDVPMELPPQFEMLVVDEREDPRDAFISNDYQTLQDLPAGAVVGTSSLRRECQLRRRFPHLKIESLRGNLDTRLRKLDEGQYQAIILAAAGLTRLGLKERIKSRLSAEDSIPAVGQGALAIEYPKAIASLIKPLIAPMLHPETEARVLAERALSRRLAGSCDIPLGAHATLQNNQLQLKAFVGSQDGRQFLEAEATGNPEQPEALGKAVAQQLLDGGAADILRACGREVPNK